MNIGQDSEFSETFDVIPKKTVVVVIPKEERLITTIIFPKIKSPFFSYLEDLCALCPVESVITTLECNL